ncbi:GNAT family N-acetyltransferase [Actinokineospora auranticolor]|uniref:N-acetylglutamate synthase-like GNAT family acetyltransferase n=1 Tax=Actinokineospora auranticolor TaxID=155976 RepID=A0A2S6GWN9_9PSEU|nr:GNAT family N-acetyltransferase [Actinokineospora auranticolor]PPK69606.1 N-acetylglutamate synthase-like GNAT family acetyltransferase [Actinokineospora auranticolor]
MIRKAVRADYPRMREIEVIAGAAFADVGLPEIAEDDGFSDEEFDELLDDGVGWVLEQDRVDAYLLGGEVGGCGHIAQVTVDPAYRGRGLGRELVDHFERWARAAGLAALTLTTFRDVPWNRPYYERIGFRVIQPTPELRELVALEAEEGLDPELRVCMRRDFS